MSKNIRKAELHVHIEGTLTATKAQELAARNGVTLPEGLIGPGTENVWEYCWQGFEQFIRTYDAVAACLRTPDDYCEITADYLIRSAEQGCVYTELLIAPTLITQMSHQDYLDGLIAGIDEAKAKTGIEARLIATIVRHLDTPEQAEDMVRFYINHPNPYVTGLNMSGIEKEDDYASFAPAYRLAREEAGFGLTVHAGEYCGPQSVRNALDMLPGLTRIGHGIRAIEDPALVEELVERGIVLEICPSSNVATGIVKDWESHPLPELMAAGVKVTLNSDDPPFFHTDIGREYDMAQTVFGFSDDVLEGMTQTALDAAYYPSVPGAGLIKSNSKA